MGFYRFDGTLTELSDKRLFNDFAVYDRVVFVEADGTERRLERAIGIPRNFDDLWKPGLKGRFYAYSIGFFGRRGVFALRSDRGERRSYFKVPGESALVVMGIISLITIVLSPFAIILFGQYAGIRAAKKAAGEAWRMDGN